MDRIKGKMNEGLYAFERGKWRGVRVDQRKNGQMKENTKERTNEKRLK